MQREITAQALAQEIKNFFALVKALRTIKKNSPHVIVHTHSTKAGLVGRWAALFAGIKHRVHTIHGYAFNDFQPWPIWFAIYFLELVTSFITTHFVCVSQYDADTGSRLFPFFKNKHTLIRAAVADAYFKAAHISQNNQFFTFGTIACFKPQKNLFDLLNAFAHVHQKHPQTRLEIIGDGALRPQIECFITQNGLNEAITLHGWQNDVTKIAHHWHAFVLTSLWEGLPCAVVEARLLGLPVISYKTGGVPEVILHDKNGFIHEQKDWPAIARSMCAMIENPTLYKQLQTYEDSFEDFHYNAMVKQHKALYEKISSRAPL